MAGFVVVLAVWGGASRGDEFSQIIVRLAAIVTCAVILIMRTGSIERRKILLPMAFLGAIAAVVLIQLVPLPPAIWTGLPGRDFAVRSYELARIPLGWHPASLTPDQGMNTVLALMPVACILAGLAALPNASSRAVPALIMIAVASAFIGLLQFGSADDTILRYYRVYSAGLPDGFFANRNHQALLLACAIPALALYIASRQASLFGDAIAAAVGLFLLLLIALTGSRSGVLTTFVGLAGAMFFLSARIRGALSVRSRVIGAAGVGLAMAATASAYFTGKLVVFERLAAMNSAGETRSRVLSPLLEMVSTFFPIGSGFGSFDSTFRRFERVEDLTFEYFNHAHNDFIEATIEGGLPAVFLMVIFALWWARSVFVIWRTERRADCDLARIGTIISAMILLASVFDYPLRTPLIACIFALACYWMHRVQGYAYFTQTAGTPMAGPPAMDTTEK